MVWPIKSGPAYGCQVRDALERSQRVDGDSYRGRENPATWRSKDYRDLFVPDGANPLPKEVFRGPYDEWYGVATDGQIGRTFVGEEIRSMEKDGLLRAS
jgi:hypothetical protein